MRVKNGFAEGVAEAAVDGYSDVKLSVLLTAQELSGLHIVGEVQVCPRRCSRQNRENHFSEY